MKFEKEDEKYYNSREKKAETIIKELSEEGISPNKKLKVLEVGCNHGFITYHLASKTKWDMHGGDVNKKNLNKYPWIKSKAKIRYLDATKMTFKNNTFDVVIYNHVIEHIPEWKNTIPEIYRVLKKGGILYLATPNLHRKLVGPRVLLKSKKNLNNKTRIDNHMGFSALEIKKMLKEFKQIKVINKKHFVSNVHFPFNYLIRIVPAKLHERYAQTNVVIAKK